MNLREVKEPSASQPTRLSERVQVSHSCRHLAGSGEVSSLQATASKNIWRICLRNLFSLFGLRCVMHFFILAIPFILNFRSALDTTDTFSPPSHRHQNCGYPEQLDCTVELALSPHLCSSDVLRLSIGLQQCSPKRGPETASEWVRKYFL